MLSLGHNELRRYTSKSDNEYVFTYHTIEDTQLL